MKALRDLVLTYFNPPKPYILPYQQMTKSIILILLLKRHTFLRSLNDDLKKNVVLVGPSGVGKTTTIVNMYSIAQTVQSMLATALDMQFSVTRLTTITRAALEGSVNGTGRNATFIPPEFALHDLIVADELSTILTSRSGVIEVFLKALDKDGHISKKLVKFANPRIRDIINSQYSERGIHMTEDFKLYYTSKSSLFSATTDIFQLPLNQLKAFVSRCDVIFMPKNNIISAILFDDDVFVPNPSDEVRIANAIVDTVRKTTITIDDIKRIRREVIAIIQETTNIYELTLRDISKIVADAIATYVMWGGTDFSKFDPDDYKEDIKDYLIIRKEPVALLNNLKMLLQKGAGITQLENLLGLSFIEISKLLKNLNAKGYKDGGGLVWQI